MCQEVFKVLKHIHEFINRFMLSSLLDKSIFFRADNEHLKHEFKNFFINPIVRDYYILSNK
jgi:hypothetical protein